MSEKLVSVVSEYTNHKSYNSNKQPKATQKEIADKMCILNDTCLALFYYSCTVITVIIQSIVIIML